MFLFLQQRMQKWPVCVKPLALEAVAGKDAKSFRKRNSWITKLTKSVEHATAMKKLALPTSNQDQSSHPVSARILILILVVDLMAQLLALLGQASLSTAMQDTSALSLFGPNVALDLSMDGGSWGATSWTSGSDTKARAAAFSASFCVSHAWPKKSWSFQAGTESLETIPCFTSWQVYQ